MAEKSSHPLIFIVEAVTPRLRYTLETVLREFLGFAYQFQTPDQPRPVGALPYFNYSDQFIPDTLAIPRNTLLFESDIRPKTHPAPHFPLSGTPDGIALEADPFAYIFYHLTEYRNLQEQDYDDHDRHAHAGQHPHCEEVLQFLEGFFGYHYDPHNAARPSRKFDFEITIDVDHPWKFRYKGSQVILGGGLKDLLQGRFATLAERIRFLSIGRMPYDVFGHIKRICPPQKTTLFFLVDGDHPHDSRYTLHMLPYQNMVRDYAQAGFAIGLHPSYTTYRDAAKIQAEKQLLESVVGPVTRSRQHYLRYRNPDTFRHLVEAGIQQDYSLCPPTHLGAKTGVVRPYRWFDLPANAETNLELVPTVAMDRTLQQYMGLPPEAALREIKAQIDQVRAFQGKFVLILHNETFSESGEWRGWRKVIAETVAYLQGNES